MMKEKEEINDNSSELSSLQIENCRLKHSQTDGRRNFILAMIGILIALFGGIPGFLSIKSYYNKSSVKIMFDENESVPCFIANSPHQNKNGDFAVLLYGVTIVGKGNQKFIAYDINISIKGDGIWYEGIRFKPVQREVTDKDGWTGNVIQVHVGEWKPGTRREKDKVSIGDTINFCDWHDFEPGISVGFGEPAKFMLAAHFPKAPRNFKEFDRIRIVVRDYLGNDYTYETGTGGLKKPPYNLFLDQSLKQK